MSGYDAECLPEYLRIYYKSLFPFKAYTKWLCYGRKPGDYFNRREFALILKDDVYLRYRSYNDPVAFEKEVQTMVPYKIDLGAVFSHRPCEHKKVVGITAQERELVFDIDLTDYDEIRTCCQGGDMCNKCWKLMIVAIKILDIALLEDFGFQHRLWVYSGRRGVHCWICDRRARLLSSQARAAVADYLTVVVGGENQKKKVSLKGEFLHPLISRSLDLISDKDFVKLCDEQKWLTDNLELITSLLPDTNVLGSREKLVETVQSKKKSEDKWKYIDSFANSLDTKGSRHLSKEIKLQFTYPRLDANVTKGLNHLLKSPFCIHPKTGKVSIPLDVSKVSLFNPDTVPTINVLIQEINSLQNKDDSVKKPLDYKRTSLADAVNYFENFVKKLIESEELHKENAEIKSEQMDNSF